jgi:hypothetical protein
MQSLVRREQPAAAFSRPSKGQKEGFSSESTSYVESGRWSMFSTQTSARCQTIILWIPFLKGLRFSSNIYVVVTVAVGMWESRSDFQERWEGRKT